jgi:hypothetical protein
MAVALAASAILVGVVGAGSAQAVTVKPCTGSGTLTVAPSGNPLHPYAWHIEGLGTCPAVLQLPLTPKEAETVSFLGNGTSDTLGICDGSLLVQNLALSVAVRYRGVVTGTIKSEKQTWHSPLSLYPVASPFLMTLRPGAGAFGAGLVVHHILLGCGNAGTMPSATFAWAELRRP